MRTIPAGRFKAQCLRCSARSPRPEGDRHEARSGRKLRAVENPRRWGSVIYLVDDDELLFSTGESWDAERT
jgi:hypothetical protein